MAPDVSIGPGVPAHVGDVLEELGRTGASEGPWTEPPTALRAERVLEGGRTDAVVLELTVHWHATRWRYVAKVAGADEAADEWEARLHLGGRANVLCVPIELATRGARDRNERIDGRYEAVVYGHAGDFAANPDMPLATLEDVVKAAVSAREPRHPVDRVIQVIERLGEGMRTVFYQGAGRKSEEGALRDLIPTLGTTLTLEVDRFHDGRLVAGPGPLRDLGRLYTGQTALTERCLSPDGPATDLVYLGPVELAHRDGAFVVESEDFARLRIAVRAAEDGPDLREVNGPVHLVGRVADRYADACWRVISRKCPELLREGHHVVHGGDRTFLPFARLHAMLTAEEKDRPVSRVHGDLNPRNVLVIDDRPFLIDFARTAPEKPTATDFVWLELGLLREVFAERYGFGELLLLQRMLALASRAVAGTDGGTDAMRAASTEAGCVRVLQREAPGLVPAFRILWAIRGQAWRSHPAGVPWWRDHLAHLAISANRMFKWAGDDTAAQVRATVAAAGAATEAWADERPYRRLERPVLRAVTTALIDRFAPDRPEGVAVVADLVREVERTGDRDPLVDDGLARGRDSAVRAIFGDAARAIVVDEDERARHDDYIRLSAYEEDDGSPSQDVQRLLAGETHVALAGEAHSGKTTVIREMRFGLAEAALRSGLPSRPLRVPLLLNPHDLAKIHEPVVSSFADLLSRAWSEAGLPGDWRNRIMDLALLGGVCLVVDDLYELDGPARERVQVLLARLVREMPRLSVVVCHRRTATPTRWPPGLDVAPFRPLVLAEPEPKRITRHIAAALFREGVSSPDEKAALMVNRLTLLEQEGAEAEEGRVPPRALRSPGLLPAAIVLVGLRHVPNLSKLSADELLAEYVQRLTGARDPRTGPGRRGWPGYAEKESILAVLARELTDRRVEELPMEELTALFDGVDRAHAGRPGFDRWRDVMDAVVDDGILKREVTADARLWIRFRFPVVREYLAARWLYGHRGDDGRPLADFVADSAWHEPIRRLMPLLDGVQGSLRELCHAALRADLGLAVTFLRAARTPPAESIDELFRLAAGVLEDSGASGADRRAAATALADYGGRRARVALGRIVRGPEYPPASRITALTALERMRRGSAAAREAVEGELRDVARTALADDAPSELRVVALDVLGRVGVHHQLPRIGELVDDAQPWPVAEAAMDALRELKGDPTDALTRRWAAACERRLADSELELRGTAAEQARLTAQRRMLLTELAAVPRPDILLRHRFRFGLDDHVAELLDAMTDPRVPDDLREVLDLHRRLPERARDVVADLAADSSAAALLQGATAVTELDADGDRGLLEHVEDLVVRLVATRAEELMEPLSALTTGVFAVDRRRGVRTALRVALMLENRDVAQRRTWPWTAAFANARGGPPDLIALLRADDRESADLAVFGLSAYGFLIDAANGPEHRLDEETRRRFIARRPTSGGREAWRYVMAAATVGATEVLPFARAVASGDPAVDATPYTVATGVYGEIENTDLGGVLAAVGYLGRVSALQGASMDDALATLLEAPVEGRHRSVALGRLAGLAYLGRWRDVLTACTGNEPRLRTIAENAVFRWSGSSPAHLREVARWIEGSPAVEPSGVLRELRRACERRSGHLVRAGS